MKQPIIINQANIEEHVLPYVPPAIAELIQHTVLSRLYKTPHLEQNQNFKSSLITVRTTHKALKNEFVARDAEHNRSPQVVRRHLLAVSKVFPTLMLHSKSETGEQRIKPYEHPYNKNPIDDFFIFPVFRLAGRQTNPLAKFYTESDVRDMFELVADWMVGHRKVTGVTPERYKQEYLTDNDYFDPSAAKDADWDTLLAKPKIGRPCKPADPFNRTKTPTQRRNSLKSVAEQLNRIEATQHRIEATQQRIEQLLTSE